MEKKTRAEMLMVWTWTTYMVFEFQILPTSAIKQLALRLIYGSKFEEAPYKEQVPNWEGKARAILRIPYIRIILLSKNIVGGAN